MSTHLAPRHAAVPTGDARLIDALAEYGHTHRRHTPKHRKPVHAVPVSGWRAEVEEHAESCPAGDDCPMLDRFTTAGLRRTHLAEDVAA